MIQTKIVCTIGPASDKPEILARLIEAGMNVARLNFSHGSHEEHAARISLIRQAAAQVGATVAILLDTKGPEIRTGELAGGKVTVREGQAVTLTVRQVAGGESLVPVSYRGLAGDVVPGSTILIDDGQIELLVEEVRGEDILCRARNSGDILPRKGVNLPGVEVNLPAVTEKDVADIRFGIAQEVDFIAASFVRRAEDVLEIRRHLAASPFPIAVIAKIESHSGVANIDSILAAADGLMVARGDLGVEIPAEKVPAVQKMIITQCNRAGKPVITATQMLDSMIRNPRPTRAEASDVYNAILDGSDAIMLSGETAAGHYPVEALQTMVRIAAQAENAADYRAAAKKVVTQPTVTDAISHASQTIAAELKAAAIITPTTSGSTARMVAKYRPQAMVIAASRDPRVLRQLNLVSGVRGIQIKGTVGTDELVHEAVATARIAGLLQPGDLVVITAGVPAGIKGSTNLIKVHVVGEAVGLGVGKGQRAAAGVARVVVSGEQAQARVNIGEIIIARQAGADYLPAVARAGGLVLEDPSLESPGVILALEMGIPLVVGVPDAAEQIPDGMVITVDGPRGQIFLGRDSR